MIDAGGIEKRQQKGGELSEGTDAILGRIEDEDMAGRSAATLLITAPTRPEVETLARRVHHASARAASPFVLVNAATLPTEPRMLRERCSALLDAAIGGSLLMSDIEDTPEPIQGVLVDMLATFQNARLRVPAFRLIAGTTASLLDRVAAGTFSEALLYRLNVIHLVVGADVPSSPIRQ